ncbi:MAG: BadF/BadG/BcrA/BcrD ATPase family protein [Gemmatimonadaceae bacterium]
MSAIVVGVDGGGSRTRAMVADESGTPIVTVEGGPSAVRPGQAEQSAEMIAATVRDALAACDMTHVLPKILCVGVAGVGRDVEREALWQALMSRDVAEDVVVHPDAMIALDDAFGDGPGLLVVSGTGSIGYGRGPTGSFARCGGWGPNCGDEGSGAWIGRRALSIVTAAQDGREVETALTGAILTAAEVNEVADLVEWAADASPAMLATLAPVVMSVARGGDLRANSLITLGVEELVLHARTLARQLFGDERASIPLALGGGLLGKGSLLRKRLVHRLKSAVPGAQIRDEDVVPVRGAVRGAIRLLGAPAA